MGSNTSEFLPVFGKILSAIYEAGNPKFEENKSGHNYDLSFSKIKSLSLSSLPDDELKGFLRFLNAFGLIVIDDKFNVKAPNRHAHFAVGSLAKFFQADVKIVDDPYTDMEKKFLITLTSALENLRYNSTEKSQAIDQSPLHHRKIVNILIKSRQLRKWKETDVYLHIYHKDWEEYHLVGLSQKNESESDNELVQKAMEKQLGLKPDKYVLEPLIRSQDVEPPLISATNGALTKYTFLLRVVKEIKIPLKLKDWGSDGKPDSKRFRWFTWEEMLEGISIQGEKIMFSTRLVLENVDLKSVPVSARRADDPRDGVSFRDILNELKYRFSIRHWLLSLFLIIIWVLSMLFLPQVMILLGRPEDVNKLADIASILGLLIAISSIAYNILTGFRK